MFHYFVWYSIRVPAPGIRHAKHEVHWTSLDFTRVPRNSPKFKGIALDVINSIDIQWNLINIPSVKLLWNLPYMPLHLASSNSSPKPALILLPTVGAWFSKSSVDVVPQDSRISLRTAEVRPQKHDVDKRNTLRQCSPGRRDIEPRDPSRPPNHVPGFHG